MDKGVVFVATGQKHFLQALDSAESVKRAMPGLPICIFSDRNSESLDGLATLIRVKASGNGYRDKIQGLIRTPFEYSLFLDTDTAVCSPVEELFEILGSFELAVAHSSHRTHWNFEEIPASFSEFNTGVLAYRKSNTINGFLRTWLAEFDKGCLQGHPHDQPSFRKALYLSKVRYATLPREYNCNYKSCGYHSGTVKIFHGQPDDAFDLHEVAKVMNSYTGRRVFINRTLVCFEEDHKKRKPGLNEQHLFRF